MSATQLKCTNFINTKFKHILNSMHWYLRVFKVINKSNKIHILQIEINTVYSLIEQLSN